MFFLGVYDYNDLFKAVSCNNISRVLDIIVRVGVYSSTEDPLKVGKFKAVEFATSWGETALHVAAKYGLLTMAQLLVAKGAVVDAQDNTGGTPLTNAIGYGHFYVPEFDSGRPDVIAFLKGKGADIDCIKRSESRVSTALAYAVRCSFQKHVALLISEGANVNCPISWEDCLDILSIALCNSNNSNYELALLLVRHGAEIKASHVQKLMKMIILYGVSLLRASLEAGLDVNQSFTILRDGIAEEKTLLLLAVEQILDRITSHPTEAIRGEVIQTLLRAGAIVPFLDGEIVDRRIAKLFLTESTAVVKAGEPKPLVMSADVNEGAYTRRRAALLLWVENHPMPDSAPIVAP